MNGTGKSDRQRQTVGPRDAWNCSLVTDCVCVCVCVCVCESVRCVCESVRCVCESVRCVCESVRCVCVRVCVCERV